MRSRPVVSKPSPAPGAIDVLLRLRFAGQDEPFGPGKVQLLELIDREGSISGAGRAMRMSYHHAWSLVDGMNAMFKEPLVRTQLGGTNGGGAEITKLGHDVIHHYRAMEAALRKHASRHIGAIEAAVAGR